MRITAMQTGTVRIRPSHRAGRMDQSEARRRLSILLDRGWTDPLPIHAYLVEHPEGLFVFDSGETARTGTRGFLPWWHPFFRLSVEIRVRPEEEIGPRLRDLGVDPQKDVRALVLSHMHHDHADGLDHFRDVSILVSEKNLQESRGWRGTLNGALPQRWPRWFAPTTLAFSDPPVGPFPRSHAITRDGRIFAVETPGHMRGHISLVVRDDDVTFFLAGDATYDEELLLAGVVDGVSYSVATSLATLRAIREFAGMEPTVLLPAHDPMAARRLANREPVITVRRPAPRSP